MDHFVRSTPLYRVDDRDLLPRRKAKHAGIARLTAAGRIKNRAVEPNAALIGGNHPRGAGPQIPIVAKQQRRHSFPICAVPVFRRDSESSSLEPRWGGEVAGLQELRVEQLGWVAGAGIGEDRHDRVAGAELAREAYGAAHID